MNFEFSLVIFTVLSQLAAGSAIFLCIDTFVIDRLEGDEAGRRKTWFCVFLCSLAGIIASLFHLGHPMSAYKALLNLGDSWLSREALIFAIFCALSFFNISIRSRALALVTALTGIAGLVAQGLIYGPPAIPALANALPMFLFLLSALALGASVETILQPIKGSKAARPFIVALLAILAIAPALWLSGSPVMEQSGVAWLHSPLFWIGLGLLVLAFAASYWPEATAVWQLVCLFFGVAATRLVFFADSFQTAGNLGLPFS